MSIRRLPVYLLIDISESMAGPAIEAVQRGVNMLVNELRGNPLALESAYLSIITFAKQARQDVALTELLQVNVPKFSVRTGTSLGAALRLLRKCLAREVVSDLQDYLDRSRNTNAPWSKARIFSARIRRNIKLAECPSFGRSIFDYAPHCNGSEDYAALAREVLGEPAPTVISTRVELDERGSVSVLSVEAEPASSQ